MPNDNIRLHSFRRLTPSRWINMDHVVEITKSGVGLAPIRLKIQFVDSSEDLHFDSLAQRDAVLQELLS